MKNCGLKFVCEPCNNGLRDIPELKQLINRILIEVNDNKTQKTLNNESLFQSCMKNLEMN